jgi:hypothetical protein
VRRGGAAQAQREVWCGATPISRAVIPEGQYGAGTVKVWERREYQPEGDVPPQEQLARGKIDVGLRSERLRGGLR